MRSPGKFFFAGLVAVLATLLFSTVAMAVLVADSGTLNLEVVDRTGFAEASTAQGALVQYLGDLNTTFGSAGTGTFDSFVRVQASPTESGYNTDGTLEFDSKSGTWTHAIKISEIPVVPIPGTTTPAFELFADLNESNSTPKISLDELEIWFANSATVTGYAGGFGGDATKVYDFEGTIQINDVNQGSGRGDLRYFVPISLVDGGVPAGCDYGNASCTQYFVLYTKYGGNGTEPYASDGGFEEWKVKQYPTLRIEKVAVGGDATFDFTVTGPSAPLSPAPSITTTSGTGSTMTYTVDGGDYTITETVPSGWMLTGAVCSLDGATPTAYTPGSIIAIPGGNNPGHLVCTFTNEAIPTLKLVKVVVNDDGGTAVANDWDLTATGTGGFTELTPAAANATARDVTAGVQYTLSETSVSGYSTTGIWSCVGGGTFVSPDKITLAAGEDVTCTITNNDIAPTLKLVKVVVNDDGGTAVANDWDLTATGTGGFTELTPAAADATATAVDAGVQYTLSETSVSGYSQSGNWSCVGGGAFVSPNKITLALDEDVTCTVTNDDNPATLKLVKAVVNDDGGTAVANDWDLSATGSSGSFTELTPAAADATATEIVAGVQYTLSETSVSGYAQSGAWSCDGGTFVSPDKITLALGDNVTCTATNDDIAPTLKLVKVVVNDDGGTAVANDWDLSATGSSRSFTELTPAAVDATARDVTAGVQYTLSETSVSGYAQSGAWSCDGGTFVSPDKITLALDQDVTCTVTNDDIAPTLKLVKVVVNDDGGAAVANDWDLLATGSSASFTELTPAAVDATARDVTAGVQYTLSETSVSGYAQSGAWSCDGGTFVSPDKITLALDQDVTCTVTNDDIAPTLKLVKVVVNDDGGTAVANDWDLLATGSSASFTELTPAAANATARDVTAGVQYTLSETSVSGYAQSGAWSCNGGTFASPDKITLALDQDVTCTVTNDDIAPTLKLVKVVVNDDGGTAVANDWDLTATGTGGFTELTPAAADATATAVDAAVQYTLSETSVSGYSQSGDWVCTGGGTFVSPDKITLALDEDVTCTVTNDDIPARIIIVKNAIGDDETFDYSVSGPTPSTPSITTSGGTGTTGVITVDAGTYTVAELALPGGWTLTASTCTSGSPDDAAHPTASASWTFTVPLDGQVTCTFENTQQLTTRTQGFWSTHPDILRVALEGGDWQGTTFAGVDATILNGCLGVDLTDGSDASYEIVLGGFWANIAKTADGKGQDAKRDELDQARMRLLQQLLAAMLNESAFGSAPTGITIDDAQTAFCSGTLEEVQDAAAAMADFNEGGDSGLFTPGVAADAKTAREDADIEFWDSLP